MAPPPTDLPPWATWATLAALALFGALVAAAQAWWRRHPPPAAQASGEGPAMGLWGHVADLRLRLIRCVAAVTLAVAFAIVLRVESRPPYLGIDPYDNLAAQVYRRMYADLVPSDVRPATFAPTDAFAALFDVALVVGVLVALPYVLYQLGQFFGPALRPRERRLLRLLVLPASALFAVGAAFCYAVILPAAYRTLYQFSDVIGAENLLNVREFVSFTLMLLLLAGLAFLTPLAMYGLARVGIATWRGMLSKWRHAVVTIVIVAAVVTPDPTPVSQMLLSGPLVGLYFLGVALAAVGQGSHERAAAAAS